MDKIISVIVPVYNVEAYVEKCIKSVLSQTYQHFELILLNDGSTDMSYDVLKKYKNNPHVTIIDKKNTGQSDTRYQGLLLAKGEYVYFVDSDDTIEPDALEILIDNADKYDADVVFGRYRLVDDKDNILREQKEYSINSLEGKENILRDALCALNFKSSLWIKLIRKNLLMDSYLEEIRSIRINEDICLSIILASYCGKVVFVNNFIYNILQRKDSLSRSIKPSLITINDAIFEIVKVRLCNINLWNKLIVSYYEGFLKSILYVLALAALKSRSFVEYQNLYSLLDKDSLYYSKAIVNNKDCLGVYWYIYKLSRHSKLFYRIILMMRPLLKY